MENFTTAQTRRCEVLFTLRWLILSLGFKLYFSLFGRFTATYGSIGAAIVLLSWLHLSAIAILIGGEVNSETEKAAGETRTG